MNINMGDSNHVVRYIQYFLSQNFNSDIVLSNVYDTDTHNYFIDYMLSPDAVTTDEMIENLSNYYPFIGTNFKFVKGYNEVTVQSKTQLESSDIEIYLTQNRTDIMAYCEENGWTVSDYNIYSPPYSMVLRSKEAHSPFPKPELLHMLNLFNNKFYYGMAIRSGSGTDDIIHQVLSTTGRTYKICAIKATANATYSICHNSSVTQRLVIGSIITDFTSVENLALKDVVDIQLQPRELYEYTTTAAVKYIMIQIDSQQLISDDSYSFISSLLVYKGTSNMNIPTDEFALSPWAIHEQLVGHVIEFFINSHSRDDDINYVQDLVSTVNFKYRDGHIRVPSVYDDEMRDTIKGIQEQYRVPFKDGYLDQISENILRQYYDE